MVVVVGKVVVLVSLKKLMYKMLNFELSWKSIFVLIIDEGISDEDKFNIENQGVIVIVVVFVGE